MSLICFLMSLGSMSHVGFKKSPFCHVEFKGLGPFELVWLSGRIFLFEIQQTLGSNPRKRVD